MPYPITAVLPPAPSRISDPVNFVNESALYLQSLPTFRTQFNALTAYINSKYPNYNNYGTVVDVNPTYPTVATFASGVAGTGVPYISSLDTFYENLGTNSLRADGYGAWIDAVIAMQGSIASDPLMAQIPAMSAPATRAQARTAFNASSIAFTENAIKSVRELSKALTYVNTTCFAAFDSGLVTQAIDATDDYGRFKATYLDGTKKLDGTYTLSVTQTTNDIVLQDAVTTLFAGNQVGLAYDFNDLNTLFQDHEGRVSVTAAGQPIGLVLDKSTGLALGAETVTNGAFTTNSTGWTNYQTARGTMSYNSVDKRLKVDNTTGTGDSYVWSAASVTAGLVYKVSGNIYDLTGDTANIKFYWRSSTAFIGSPLDIPVVNGYFTTYLRVPATTAGVAFGSSNTAGTWELDNISVKQVTGDHAIQTVAAARPTLQRNTSSGAFYASFDGVNDALYTVNSLNLSTVNKLSIITAIRTISSTDAMLIETGANVSDNAGSFYLTAPEVNGAWGSVKAYASISRGSAGLSVDQASYYTPLTTPNTAVITATHDIAASKSTITSNRLAGVTSTGTKGTGNFGNLPLYIGARAGTTLPFNGHVYSLIIVGKLLSDGDIYETEKILADRIGILV